MDDIFETDDVKLVKISVVFLISFMTIAALTASWSKYCEMEIERAKAQQVKMEKSK